MGIDVTFLKEGQKGQALQTATQLAEFIKAAKSSLHIAIYDFRLKDPKLSDLVLTALNDKAAAGVEVKLAYYAGRPAANTSGGDNALVEMDINQFIEVGGDPAPIGTDTFLENMPKDSKVEMKGITGSKLMHNKYIVRDVNTSDAALWTGSANFTDDAWTYQENNIVQITSPELCTYYETDFQELWQSGDIRSTGVNDTGTVQVGQITVDVAFAPGEGQTIDQMISSVISTAKKRIKIASMVITSHGILGALDDAIQNNQVADFGGIYDGTQMANVLKLWQKSTKSDAVAATFKEVATHLASKHSTPYSPTGKHDFMHNKIVVCDDVVVTGSYNFSRSATQNSENVLVLHDRALADKYSAYIDELIKHYKATKTTTKKA